MKKGDVLSESSHFIVQDIVGDNIELYHVEKKEDTIVSLWYINKIMSSADNYDEEIEVTKDDKKDGTPGIRTIWKGIHSEKVFTVCFKKKDKAKSKAQIKKEIDDMVDYYSDKIDETKANKKGVASLAKDIIENLIQNPILPYNEGEERVLRGYKVQFESITGEYQCVDMDLVQTEEFPTRLVNVNTIKYLIYGGKKYVVK